MVRPAAGGHASDSDSEACSATGTVRPHISYMRATDSVARSVTVLLNRDGAHERNDSEARARPIIIHVGLRVPASLRPPMPNARPAHWQDRLGLLTPARAARGSVVFLALTY